MKAVYAHGDEWRAENGPVARPFVGDANTLFHLNAYHGGALVLYALRQKIGDRRLRPHRARVRRPLPRPLARHRRLHRARGPGLRPPRRGPVPARLGLRHQDAADAGSPGLDREPAGQRAGQGRPARAEPEPRSHGVGITLEFRVTDPRSTRRGLRASSTDARCPAGPPRRAPPRARPELPARPIVVAEIIGTLQPSPTLVATSARAPERWRSAATQARVLAVELAALVRVLRSTRPTGRGRVRAGDALRVPFPDERFHLVIERAVRASAPQLVRRVLRDAHGLARGVIVLQRETALRLASERALRRRLGAVVRAARSRPDPAARVPAGAERRVGAADDRPAPRPAALARRLRGLRRLPDPRLQRPRDTLAQRLPKRALSRGRASRATRPRQRPARGLRAALQRALRDRVLGGAD